MADGSLIFDTKLDTNGISTGLKGIGSIAGTAFKGTAVAVGAAATAIGALTMAALNSYASYEQLSGGVETLFKGSADQVMQYASIAYQTAGMSANAYMETVTGFSASLIQSLGGDTAAAAKIADMAILDMSDNANKMGTDITMIQNAYQGFAKQNYTMLDNLKLGYGGTKTEMERLLADAEKISGIKYDISSFADVASAIHVIQEEMGIAGTTALEASSTIEGSLKAVGASWENLLTGLADKDADLGGLIDNLVSNIATAGENILPVISNILVGIGELITTMVPQVLQLLPGIINDVLPQLLEAAASLINGLVTTISENLNSIIDLGMNIITQLAQVITDNLPIIIEAGLQIILQLALGILQAIPQIIPVVVSAITTIISAINENAGMLISAGVQVISQLALGLAEALPVLVPTIVSAVLMIVSTLLENVGLLMEAAVALILGLAEGLVAALPLLIEMAPQIVLSLLGAILAAVPLILEAGFQLILTLGQAMIGNIPLLLSQVPIVITQLVNTYINYVKNLAEVGTKIVNTIKDAVTKAWPQIVNKVSGWIGTLKSKFGDAVSKFTDIGKNIVDGIWNGISSGWKWLTGKIEELASSLLTSAKKALGIASPSKEFRIIGEMCVAGFDQGVEPLFDGDRFADGINATVNTIRANIPTQGKLAKGDFNQTVNVYRETSSPDELARAVRLESKYGLMKGVTLVNG